MKRFYLSLLLALSVLAACKDGGGGGATPDNPTPPGPEQPVDVRSTLMELFTAQIEKQKDGTPRDRIFLVGHRANSYAAVMAGIPENSVPAIECAIEQGIDMVELDVRPTKDNVLVLMHNATINSTTTGKGNVSDYTYEELMQYDMKRGSTVYRDANNNSVKIPTLEEALSACKDKIYVNLDVKDADVAKLCRIIKKCGMVDQVMVYTGSSVSVATEYQYANYQIAVHPYISKASDTGLFSALPGAKLFQYGYDLYGEGGNPEIGREIRARHYLSYSNLLNYDSQILSGNYTKLDAFIACESDFLQTDYSEKVEAYLKTKNLR